MIAAQFFRPAMVSHRRILWASWPILVMWLMYAFACAGAWLSWGVSGWPVGSFWWDELALSGAVHAMNTGLKPAVDFWAPFILPLYIKQFSQSLWGFGAGYVLECLLQGGVVLFVLSGILGFRRHPASVYLFGGLIVFMAILPFNIGSFVQARLGDVVYAGVYNRLGGALIMLALLLPAVWKSGATRFDFGFWVGCLLSLAFFVKVTVFQIILLSIVSYGFVVGERGWWVLVLRGAFVSLVVVGAVLLYSGMALGYFGSVHEVSVMRAENFVQHRDGWLDLIALHRFELFILIFFALLYVCRARVVGFAWLRPVVWYGFVVALVTLFMLTNYGDNGLFPTMAAMFSLSALSPRRSAVSGANFLISERFDAAVSKSSQLLLMFALIAYLVLNLVWFAAFLARLSSSVFAPAEVKSSFFMKNPVLDVNSWRERTPLHVPGVPRNMQSVQTFAGYIEGLDEGASILRRHFPERGISVYALDFPAYVFSLMEGFRVPRGTRPWLLFGHEISVDHHPPAQPLFADVDVLMVSKCSLSGGNRRYLGRIYRLEIEKNWSLVEASRCWDAYQRVTGPGRPAEVVN